ncbi:MAG: valine--tRNA ligase [Chitinophagales bacterium]|nr:valine--tRNA ligase [Chitinophagales bacterium]
MELPKNLIYAEIEKKWYQHWLDKDYFSSIPDERTPFTIVIPPPNVTGVLHMGHMLNNTIQDILIRKARLQGYNACWVPGTDHASIATEAKVVNLLKEQQGKTKQEIGRAEFLKLAFDWKEKYGGIILDQLKKLGASCDWKRTRFTMDESLSKAVIQSFIDLYNKGLIYRGVRMTNWDPVAKTAVSDEEVIHKEVNSNLYYVKYQIENSEEFITIATTRPETIMGDTAVCVNPNDERYKQLIGKNVIVPIVNRSVPVIADDYIEIDFGTGTLKVTPAHDINDYNIGQKHNIATIDVLNDDGTINKHGLQYEGLDRFVARKKVAADLEEQGLLVKTEPIKNKVGFSERTDAVIEPRLTKQWFLKMDDLAKPALEHVMNDDIQFFPPRFKNLYKHWLENIRDWCISRQLWWGQQIPAFYDENENYVIAKDLASAQKLYQEKYNKTANLTQDEDVVDTWFSSWLWPISVFDGFESDKEINYYYPTNVLVTGWDIIFFWVARMIMAGYEFKNEKPFQQVYFTGMVRDNKGRKMSKSLGNSPDPLELIDRFSADGVRVGILLAAPAGNDILFDEKLCEQGRNFSNKIWNALRLIKGWQVEARTNNNLEPAIALIENKLQQLKENLEQLHSQFRLSEALMELYKFIWDDFCSWYLEFIKPNFGDAIDQTTYNKTINIFNELMILLHPFMPFLTEEIYHQLNETNEDIIVAKYPAINKYDATIINDGEHIKAAITSIREVRNKNQISPKVELKVYIDTNNQSLYNNYEYLIKKTANLSSIEFVNQEVENTITQLVDKDKLYIETGIEIDVEAEKEKIEKDIQYFEGFIASIQKKLSNEKFVQNAKAEIVETERKKLQDGLDKLQALQETLKQL